MKYCFHCGRVTVGEPLFCNHCGRSYDVKLCPKLHANPRAAEVCSQCGSRDLSTPQPRVPWWANLALTLGPMVALMALVLASGLLVAALVQDVLSNPQTQADVALAVFLLIALWFCWLQVPKAIRTAIYSWLRKRREKPDTGLERRK